MRRFKILLGVILATVLAIIAFARTSADQQSREACKIVSNGKTLNYTIAGRSVSSSGSLDNGVGRVQATVDGVQHEITVTPRQLRWNERQVALKGFAEVDITIKDDDVLISVDGEPVLSQE